MSAVVAASSGQSPRVSIGMPVRNGQKYIREAIDSIRAQTFSDWELVICDNASTDNTESIVREYAQRDARIRYHKNERDIGPAGNHNVCFKLARGEYFRWHAHDDLIGADYLARCVEGRGGPRHPSADGGNDQARPGDDHRRGGARPLSGSRVRAEFPDA